MTKFKEISLNNNEFFDLSIGKRILKRNLRVAKGSIPVYSANVFIPIGHMSKSNIKDFNNNFVLWGIDGNFEFNFIKKNKPFVSTDHCGVIRILNDEILPEYLKFKLEEVKHVYGFDRGLRASLKNMKTVKIKIPFDGSSIDVDEQKRIIEKSKLIKELKEKLNYYKEKIQDVKINLENEYTFKKEKLSDIFKIKQGNAYYTKKRVIGSGWHGDVPVYSSNTKQDGLLMRMDLKKIKSNDLYYQKCLTWSVDGYAGTLFLRNENNEKNEKNNKYFFTINNHCGILLPKKKQISLRFMRYILQPKFYEKSKGYGNKKVGTNQIENIEVKIPVDKNGDFDLTVQNKVADKIENIEYIKNQIALKLNDLITTTVIIE